MEFKDIKSIAKSIMESYAARDSEFDQYMDMYLMEDAELPSEGHIKPTISPDARNSLLGATRLLTASDPSWTVPHDKNVSSSKKVSNNIEKFCRIAFENMSRIKRKPPHYTAILSGFLFDEIHLSVTLTDDLVARAASPAEKLRAERVASQTPFIIDVLTPRHGYPVFDNLGLSAYYSFEKKTVAQIRGAWGDKVEDKLMDKKVEEPIDYSEYWDLTWHTVWIEGEDDPILHEEHKLDVIPIICAIVEGNEELFSDELENTRQPFFFTLKKSKLWNHMNLVLTVMSTMTFAIGSNPMFIAKMSNPDDDLIVDYSVPGSVIKMRINEEYQPLPKNAIDKSLMELLAVAEEKTRQSTIYRQALGEPLGGNAPYSMVALLSQSGRLPLITVQRISQYVFADAMYCGLMLYKAHGKQRTFNTDNDEVDLTKEEVPTAIVLNCILGIEMPQDEGQNAEIALRLSQGDNPLASKRYAREKHLKIGQSDDMEEEIAGEKLEGVYSQLDQMQEIMRTDEAMKMLMEARQQLAQMEMQQEMQRREQEMGQAQGGQGMPQQGVPPQGVPPQGVPPQGVPPQGMPAEQEMIQQQAMMDQAMMQQQMQQQMQGAQPGMETGLPPEVLQEDVEGRMPL